jgi:uncharacterized protein YukE
MGLANELAELPGGEELARLVGRVEKIDAPAVDEIVRHWRDVASALEIRAKVVAGRVADLDGAWKGDSADAFVDYMGRFGAAADAVGRALTDAATQLARAADLLDGLRAGVNKSGEDGLVAGRKIADNPSVALAGGGFGGVIGNMLEARVASAIMPYRADAERKIRDVEAELRAVVSALGGMGAIEPSFTALPESGGEAFTPVPGRRVDWAVEGVEKPGATSAQEGRSSDNSSGGPTGGGGSTGSGADGGGGGGVIGGGGPSGPPPSRGGPAPRGQVAEWINEAIEILKAEGYPVEKMNPNDIWNIIQHESGGNPNAINNWDSNAAKGTPSKGLMQCIDPTFNAHKLSGHDNIYHPVDNIIAGVRYAVDRYGSVSDVPGVVATRSGGGYRGY